MRTPDARLGIRAYIAGMLAGVLLAGCASFAYKYYGMEGITYKDGKLLGPKPELDRPFADCQPNGEHKHPCVVMFATEFFAMKKDFEETKLRLMQCERDKEQ